MPEPVEEYKFCPARKWRFDYAWPGPKVALEIEGGIWTGGRHTRGAGFSEDMDKYNMAGKAGWRVFRFTPDRFKSGDAHQFMKKILEV
jgi:very-short-patch-repair endonuclease